jgi:hypothetical protein
MDHLLNQLASPDFAARMRAYAAIDANPRNWTTRTTARALMQLAKREDSVVVAIPHESGGKEDADSKYGEGYADYTGQVLDRCLKFCEWDTVFAYLVHTATAVPDLRRDRVELFVILYGDSRFTLTQRAVIHSTFVGAAADPTSFLTRESALSAIRVALQSGLAIPSEQRRLHHAVVVAAHDPYIDVRLAAVRLLSDLRDSADLPVLRRIASEDTARSVRNGVVRYPVRDEAKLAMAGICGMCKAP